MEKKLGYNRINQESFLNRGREALNWTGRDRNSMAKKHKQLDTSNMIEFVNAHDVAFIDFTATWCGPCKIMGRLLTELNKSTEPPIGIGQVDIDKNKDLAQYLEVNAVPTLFIFHNGKKVLFTRAGGDKADRITGVRELSFLKQVVADLRK